MLYYLFTWLYSEYHFPGAGVFQFISFRAALAIILSLVISTVFGKPIINYLHRKQVGESIRDLGLDGQIQKQGTPTMGGLIILSAILIPTLLLAKISNVYIVIMLFTTVWLGLIGFIDDYIKVFKKNKAGLSARSKMIGQTVLGLAIATTLYFNKNVTVRREVINPAEANVYLSKYKLTQAQIDSMTRSHYVNVNAPITTIPFVKTHEFNYGKILTLFNANGDRYTYFLYVLIVIFIITAVSNAANLTDGIDGLATGVSAIIGAALGVFAYVSGNINVADYLNIMYIPNSGEVVIFLAAFIGGCVGFLWYNAFPAQIFMGDTGSLALGGIIATLAIILRKELLIPILCGIFFVESLSVLIQVGYFKYTKKRYGEGRRIFKMAPLHHHYQKAGYPEPKIATRFWIVGILLAILSIVTLKLR